MPVIYLQTSDGTRIIVPEEASGLSAVMRSALDNWAEKYGPPPQQTEEDEDYDEDDEEVSNTNTSTSNINNNNNNNNNNSSTDSERTPDHINDDSDDESESDDETVEYRNNNNINNNYNYNNNNMCSQELEENAIHSNPADLSDDTDRTASFIDDDVYNDNYNYENENENEVRSTNNSTPSLCLTPETPSMTNTITNTQKRGKTPKRGTMKLKLEENEKNNKNSRSDSLGRHGNGEGNNNNNNNNREDSATPSTLDEDEDDEEEKEEEEEDEDKFERNNNNNNDNNNNNNNNNILKERKASSSLEETPLPELSPPAAHAHPLASIDKTTSVKSEISKSNDNIIIALENNGSSNDVGSNNIAAINSSSSLTNIGITTGAPVINRRSSTTVVVASPSEGYDEERFTWNAHHTENNNKSELPIKTIITNTSEIIENEVEEEEEIVVGGIGISLPPNISPRSLTDEDFISPGSYHQRTPCMIGDDDDSLLLGGSTASSISEDFNLQNKGREGLSPSSCGGAELPSPHQLPNSRQYENSNNNNNSQGVRQRTSLRASSLENDGDGISSVLASSSSGGMKANETSNIRTSEDAMTSSSLCQHIHLTKDEIIIELHCFMPNSECDKQTLPSTTSFTGEIKGNNSISSHLVGASQTLLPQSNRTSQSFINTPLSNNNNNNELRLSGSIHPLETSSSILPTTTTTSSNDDNHNNNHNNNHHHHHNQNHNHNHNSTVKVSQPIGHSLLMRNALELCSIFLKHFGKDGEESPQRKRLRPTTTPQPLPAPLVSLITPWERNFIYRDILGQSEAQVELAMAIVKKEPAMSYLHPAPFLSNPTICTALFVAQPEAERISLLVEVIRVAGVLKIVSLQSMCIAWVADYMLRVSYASNDAFEAAELVRQCFHIRNDWTRKELDSLKLENEWPGNEEE